MSSIFFKSRSHRARFLETIQRLDKVYDVNKLDPEYASAIYILTADNATWLKAEKYVSRHGIDFDALLHDVDFSGGYGVLIRLARNLFTGYYPDQERTESGALVAPVEVVCRLDEHNYKVAISALHLRRYSYLLGDFKEIGER